MNDYGIRQAARGDRKQLEDLYRQLAEAEHALDTPYRVLLPPTPKRISEMHRRLNALGSDSIWWVACKPERLIGSLCVRELRPSPLVVRVMEISDVVVDRHHRRRGIASALVERAFGWAHERGNAGGCRGQHGGSSTVRGPRHVPTGRTLARDLHTLTN